MRLLPMFVSALVPTLLLAASPSLDCGKATGKVPALLCTDDALAQLDRKMAETYEPALRSMTEADRNTEQGSQRRWMGERDACAGKKDKAVPGEPLRIADHRPAGQGCLVTAPPPTLYDCGTAGTVTAYFYNDTQLPAAVVNVGASIGDLAVSQPTGSGAKYGGRKLTFWTRGTRPCSSVTASRRWSAPRRRPRAEIEAPVRMAIASIYTLAGVASAAVGFAGMLGVATGTP